jgi:hypothetical protein
LPGIAATKGVSREKALTSDNHIRRQLLLLTVKKTSVTG